MIEDVKKTKASCLLADAAEVLKYAEQCDVADFRNWLLNDHEKKPLLCIGNGGKHTFFPSLLYGLMDGVAKTITPLEFASLSPQAIAGCKILLLSASGRNMDVVYAAKRAMKYNPDNTACLTFVSDPARNKVVKLIKKENFFCYKNPYVDGFISIRSKIFTCGVLYKAFTGCEKFADKLNFDLTYNYIINKEGELPSFKNIKHYCVLYGSYGEPVAHGIESVMAEAGIASVQLCDYRNYCHGRFIFGWNHCQCKRYPETDVCMVMLISPHEKRLAEQIRHKVLPANMPIVEITTELNSSLATLQLLLNALHFTFDMAENHCDINPNNPPNYASLDKRIPINGVNFAEEFKMLGELKLVE